MGTIMVFGKDTSKEEMEQWSVVVNCYTDGPHFALIRRNRSFAQECGLGDSQSLVVLHRMRDVEVDMDSALRESHLESVFAPETN